MTTTLQRNWTRIKTSIGYRGIPFTLLWCLIFALRQTHKRWFLNYRSRQFDRRYAVDTAGVILPNALGLSAGEAELSHDYQPCSPETLAEALASLSLPLQDYEFVDLGSGKGMGLLAASMFPFKRVIGVEWSEGLSRVARENVRKFTHPQQKCREFAVVHGDATKFDFPEEPLVIYMFNPFEEALVRRTIRNLGDSLEQRPRHIVVIYHNPKFKLALDEVDFLRKCERTYRGSVAVYETDREAGKSSGQQSELVGVGLASRN